MKSDKEFHGIATQEDCALPFLSGGRIPCLDTWRGISIFFVLISHNRALTEFPDFYEGAFFRGAGALGVRSFFVISGFLITLLLFREFARTGKINTGQFFLRRSLRIFPVYFAFVAFIYFLTTFTPYQLTSVEWVTTLTFTRNFFGDDWTTGHLWSLAVEQQFYLLWPFCFVMAIRLSRPVLLWLILLIPLLGATFLRWMRYRTEPEPWFFSGGSFLLHMDSLAAGCAVAVAVWYWREVIAGLLKRYSIPLTILFLIAMFLPLWFWNVPQPYSKLKPIWPLCQACGFAGLMLVSLANHKTLCWKWMELRPLVFFGTISYSLYIWQQFFCTNPEAIGLRPAWWNSYPLWMVASVLAAIASYHLVEKPFLGLKSGKWVLWNPPPKATQV